MRNEKEREGEARQKLALKEHMIEKRIFSLAKERKRIKSHKGEYVDTDAWMEVACSA